jgi:hypothetical protein
MFVLYTAARAGLFLACWGLIWLVIGWWVQWDALNALSTAMLALIVSSVIAFVRLKGLRERFAAEVDARARRATEVFNARRAAEDTAGDDPVHTLPEPTGSTSSGDRKPNEQP